MLHGSKFLSAASTDGWSSLCFIAHVGVVRFLCARAM